MVSPKNKNFMLLDNKFLVGKCRPNIDKFDVLYMAKFDIEEVVIPPQIIIIGRYSFYNHHKLKSVIMKSDSTIKEIGYFAFSSSSICKLVLPASVTKIDKDNFIDIKNLVVIELSPRNKYYSLFNKKLLFEKSKNGDLETLVFCCRDVENITIPSSTKEIWSHAFQYCTKIKSITFEPNSSLERIGQYSFSNLSQIKKITFPQSLKIIQRVSFGYNECLESIEFLSTEIEFTSHTFRNCPKLTVVTFCNANTINVLYNDSLEFCPETTIFKVKQNVKLTGKGVDIFKTRIQYIDEAPETSSTNPKRDKSSSEDKKPSSKPTKDESSSEDKKPSSKLKQDKLSSKDKKPSSKLKQNKLSSEDKKQSSKPKKDKSSFEDKKPSSKQTKNRTISDKESEKDEEISLLKKRIRYLESRLKRYEPVPPFDENFKESIDEVDDFDDVESEFHSNSTQDNIFIDNSDEEFHDVISKTGEGSTSITFKVIDKRTGELMCKKILKVEDDDNHFEGFQNNFKEFEVLHMINHPCICKAIGLNLQEKLISNYDANNNHDDNEKTTIAVFMLSLSIKFEDNNNEIFFKIRNVIIFQK